MYIIPEELLHRQLQILGVYGYLYWLQLHL